MASKTPRLNIKKIIFKTIGEGLAILVSGQSLSEHHEKQDKNYKKYTRESFNTFNTLIKEQDKNKIKNMYHQGFQNMGHFYMAGNEIAKTVLQYEGIDKFKALLVDIRNNPRLLLQKYQEIYQQHPELYKIN